MDKLKNLFKTKNKLMFFLIILFIVGIIAGSIFVFLLKDADKTVLSQYMKDYFSNLDKIDYIKSLKYNLSTNIIYVFLIWILGISIIGVPIIIIIYFVMSFILGFSISSIIYNYSFKGLLLGFTYIFPFEIINTFIFAIISMYAIVFSINLVNSLVKHKEEGFSTLFDKYKYILLIGLIIIIISVRLKT